MTIEGHHGKFVGIACGDDARNVALFGKGHCELAGGAALEVVAVDRHGGVLRTSDGIFIVVGARILGIFWMTWGLSLKHLHAIDGNFGLVVTHPAQHLTVGTEIERSIGGEFFFIHPVGDAIDDFIALAIFGDLGFCIAIEELHDKEVVVAHEGNDIAIGRKARRHLRTSIGKGSELAICHIVDVVNGCGSATIDGFGLRAQQDFLLIRTHDVAINAREFGGAASFLYIENHPNLLTSLERTANDAFAIDRKLRVAFTIVEGMHAINVLRGDGSSCDVFKSDARSG